MRMKLLAAIAALAMAAPTSAAVQIVENGKLTGATGVDVGGTLYDVTFLDGSCISIFGSCSNASFDFHTAESAGLAGQALLDQVFLGIYDTSPGLTNGCSSSGSCQVTIPFFTNGTDYLFRNPFNTSTTDGDFISSGTASNGFDSGAVTTLTFANFSLSAVTPSVPEPSTWAMMLLGFGAMGVSLRRNRRKAGAMLAQLA